MDNFDSNDSASSGPGDVQEVQQEEELSHSDKMVGIFTEPAKTFERMSKFPPRTMDWFTPMLILLVLVFIAQILMMTNKEIYYQIKQKQMARIEKNLNEMVKKGQLTQDQMNSQMNKIQDRFDQPPSVLQMVLQGVGILIFGFIIFFIITGIYFLFSKFVFKGDGSYQSALVASGMVAYIGMIQIILTTILAFVMGKMLNDFSAASFMNADKTTLSGFLLAKLDVFSIWSYSILSIGLAKMFKASSTLKYFLLVFGVWILGGFLLYLLAEVIPFLKFFGI